MTPGREHFWWALLSLVSLQLCACTLSGDYDPPNVDDRPAPEAGTSAVLPAATLGTAARPAEAALPAELVEPQPGEGQQSPSCSSSSELPGCELPRAELTPASARCSADSDCASGHCSSGRCAAASCSDGIRNQGESGVDCAGPCAARCAEGDPCSSSMDCASGLSCPASTQLCSAPSCQDGLQNGTESAVDCGGSCAGCGAGGACHADGDCASGVCRDGSCATPSCDDLVRNQDETDIDCGGLCGACAPGRACALDSDCESGACQDGSCCGGQEGDCTRCARRLSTSLQCTSNGSSAEVAAACNAFLQCLADQVELCPRRNSPGCSDAGGVCDVSRFGNSSAIALADGIIGTAQCNF
ncbi:MAG TPA: hypothetical protein VFS67_36445 [Polyangiaceae bacterium]|jgi:hypothetical protein|nr:hypothetical protein [Polyangiaceae bacterium]